MKNTNLHEPIETSVKIIKAIPAEDMTHYTDDQIQSVKATHYFNLVLYHKGTYGINARLLVDEKGKLYKYIGYCDRYSF